MLSRESEATNRVYPEMSQIPEESFVYRETWWIQWLFATVLALIGFGLIISAFSSVIAGIVLSGLICMIGMAVVAYAGIYLRQAGKSVNFICARDGIFFPENKKLLRRGEAWLFVPWQNILDYRVQLLFDETSSRGLVLTIAVNHDEQARFFAKGCLFNLPAQGQKPVRRNIQVGYATFLPQPNYVLAMMRSYDSLIRPKMRDGLSAPATPML